MQLLGGENCMKKVISEKTKWRMELYRVD